MCVCFRFTIEYTSWALYLRLASTCMINNWRGGSSHDIITHQKGNNGHNHRNVSVEYTWCSKSDFISISINFPTNRFHWFRFDRFDCARLFCFTYAFRISIESTVIVVDSHNMSWDSWKFLFSIFDESSRFGCLLAWFFNSIFYSYIMSLSSHIHW